MIYIKKSKEKRFVSVDWAKPSHPAATFCNQKEGKKGQMHVLQNFLQP
jgi:hypothetical protein